MSKLKTKYESHEAKRQLCNSYDMFAADERVLPSLPKLLGAGRGGASGGQHRRTNPRCGDSKLRGSREAGLFEC